VEGDGVLDEPAQTAAAQTGADRAEQDTGTPVRTRRRMSWLTETVVLVIVALLIATVLKTFVVQPFSIPSGSMQDTLLIHDKVLVNKLVGHVSQIHRGDIVVFDGAGNWDPPATESTNPVARIYRNLLGLFGNDFGQVDYIKRVIGLPGDHVICCDAAGLITVNGVPLHESSYLFPGSAPSEIRFSIVVPPGRLWVMGDNRGDSSDSRLHDCAIRVAQCQPWDRDGTVQESSVIGRAFMVVWPLSKLKVLWVPADFSHIAAAPASASAPLRVVPASPALPLTAGLLLAVPLTLLERRLRSRLLRRRARR
jgi:signal peptidase I